MLLRTPQRILAAGVGNNVLNMKKHRRIYYVPGIISLIVLPIICYYYLIPFQKEERVLEVFFPEKYRPEFKNSQLIRYDTSILSRPENKRKYLVIRLNGNPKEDKVKLDFFRIRIREMKRDNDTINGTHLLFLDSVKYGTFVQSINICLEEDLIRYMVYGVNLWVLHIKDTPKFLERRKKSREESKKMREEQRLEKAIASKLSFRERIDMYKKYWPIFIVLSLLSFLSIRELIKKE